MERFSTMFLEQNLSDAPSPAATYNYRGNASTCNEVTVQIRPKLYLKNLKTAT